MGRYYCDKCGEHMQTADHICQPRSKPPYLPLACLLLVVWNLLQGCQLREQNTRLKDLQYRIEDQEQQKFASFLRMHEERIRSLENSLSILKK